MIRNRIAIKSIAVFFITLFLSEILFPTAVLALTSGPSSPEFSSFEPVATTDMVNVFSGDFTYNLPVLNIPGPDGGGYSMSLSYHSGASSEEEASWVGYGWTLNPGAINRQERGIPDDFDGSQIIEKYNKVRPNWSGSMQENLGIEFYSVDVAGERSIRYNNYGGFNRSFGFNVGYKGMSMGLSQSDGTTALNTSAFGTSASITKTGFSISVNPQQLLASLKIEETESKKEAARNEWKSRKSKTETEAKTENLKDVAKESLNQARESGTSKAEAVGVNAIARISSAYSNTNFANFTSPVNVSEYIGISYNRSSSGQIDPVQTPVGIEAGFSGNFNVQATRPQTNYNSFGYMYNPGKGVHALDNSRNEWESSNILSDYSVEKESAFDRKDYYLGIPFNSADNFSISGEGIGGGFRMHLDEIGHFYPDFVRSDQRIKQMAVEFQVGLAVGIGFDFGIGDQTQKMQNWKDEGNTANSQFQFAGNNPGIFKFTNDLGGKLEYSKTSDLTVAGIEKVGSVNLPGAKKFKPNLDFQLSDNSPAGGWENVGRSSYIGYTKFDNAGNLLDSEAFEKHADITGLRSGGTEVKNTLAEICTHNTAGMRYVYGLPVYSRNQFSINVGIDGAALDDNNYIAHDQIVYTGNDILKNKTVVGESKPDQYANTFLLTQITTPDYVDVDNNGPTINDFGGWTRFAYRDAASTGTTDWYRFRVPYNGMLYHQGSIADTRDDMGSITSGEKQIRYLSKVETKTHVAYFVTNKSDFFDKSASGDCAIGDVNIENDFTAGDACEALAYLGHSGIDRTDGLGAKDIVGDEDLAMSDGAKNTDRKLEKLEKIVLFSKARPERPIQTINFEYDNSLVQGLPNSIDGSGKLTLKKVWFEHEGVFGAKIAPYEFDYRYPTNYPSHIKAKYQHILDNDNLLPEYYAELSDVAQNPNYEPFALDAWGNYQYNGGERYANQQKWVDQKDNDPLFDPAAWQLKQITLPSGGQIHVQYEQKDYAFVQDRPTMAMVSLLPSSTDAYGVSDNKFYLDLSDLDNSVSQMDLKDILSDYFGPYYGEVTLSQASGTEALKEEMIDLLGKQKDKIYFKFLYALKGNNPQLDNCKSEYISGYTDVNEVGEDGGGVYLVLGSNANVSAEMQSLLSANVSWEPNTPKQVCFNFVTARRGGMFENDDCNPIADFGGLPGLNKELPLSSIDDALMNFITDDGSVFDAMTMEENIKKSIAKNKTTTNEYETDLLHTEIPLFRKKVKQGVGKAALLALQREMSFKQDNQNNLCGAINHELSYLRIPIARAKKGGGVRVKRLLMFDPGIEGGDAAVYGSEYRYVTEEGGSSGVATNEPQSIREENALVGILPETRRDFLGRAFAGRDKNEAEGPLGESLLPAPSVGHSRVEIRNIHTGNTGTGYQVHEFFTVKDYPFDRLYSGGEVSGKGVEATSIKNRNNKKRDWMRLPTPLFSYMIDKYWTSQGYRFIINEMHGKQKRTATYGQTFDTSGGLVNGSDYLSTETTFEYYEPGEKVKMLRMNSSGAFEYVKDTPGKEEDITMEMRSIEDKTLDLSLELDITIGLSMYPPIYVTFSPSIEYNETELNTHVVTKVLRYPSLQKATTNFQDGIYHRTENLAFNEHTGDPVVTMNTDGYDNLRLLSSTEPEHIGKYYTWNIPASWIYDEMGPISENMDNKNMLTQNAGELTGYGTDWLGEFNDVDGVQTWDPYAVAPTDVVSASAQTFNNMWFTANPDIVTEFGVASSDVTELDKNWKLHETYAYKDERKSPDKAYNSGMFNNFVMFNWGSGTNDSRWIKTNEVTKYSPNGNALEEISLPENSGIANTPNIYSASKYGDHLLPIMVAQNAKYNSIVFHDFEQPGFELGVAHSGKRSFNYNNNGNTHKFINSTASENIVVLDNHLFEKGASVKVWVKSSYANNNTLSNPSPDMRAEVNNDFSVPFVSIARTGEWELLEAKIKDWGNQAVGDFINLKINYAVDVDNNETVFMDDFRFQPLDAQSTCFAYDDATLRLVAQFDDQHFGVFFQYDNEGKLVRRLIETERGLKTLQENQFNTPEVPRITP